MNPFKCCILICVLLVFTACTPIDTATPTPTPTEEGPLPKELFIQRIMPMLDAIARTIKGTEDEFSSQANLNITEGIIYSMLYTKNIPQDLAKQIDVSGTRVVVTYNALWKLYGRFFAYGKLPEIDENSISEKLGGEKYAYEIINIDQYTVKNTINSATDNGYGQYTVMASYNITDNITGDIVKSGRFTARFKQVPGTHFGYGLQELKDIQVLTD
ncbi:MAG TPA: hypothetical protein PLZ84_06930 [Clostridia bacterium]|nr:hypothetical protein [Clostridia bacterium]